MSWSDERWCFDELEALRVATAEYFEAKDKFKAAAENPKCTNQCFAIPRDAMFAAEKKLRGLIKGQT